MRKLFQFILLISLCFLPQKASADLQDPQIKKMANEVISGIYKDIEAVKDKYSDLKLFTSLAMKKNAFGVYEISYTYTDVTSASTKVPLEIWLTVTDLNQANKFEGKRKGIIELGFPVLGVKISGYQSVTPRKKQFSLQEFVNTHGRKLFEYEQQQLPIQLKVWTEKEVFQLGEEIEFFVTLANTSKINMKVKDLNEKTLFILYDGTPGGAVESQKKPYRMKNIILKPGEEITKSYKGGALWRPTEFEVVASYSLIMKGINPADMHTIRVVR